MWYFFYSHLYLLIITIGIIYTSCSAALCLDPPALVNGMRTFTGNSVGDTAAYTCNSGFELIGDITTTCTVAADGNSATFPAVPPPECRREYFMNTTRVFASLFSCSMCS